MLFRWASDSIDHTYINCSFTMPYMIKLNDFYTSSFSTILILIVYLGAEVETPTLVQEPEIVPVKAATVGNNSEQG